MRIFLIMVTVIFFSPSVWAADPEAPAPATVPATDKVINDDDVPAPTNTKASLSDLRDQQIETDNENAEARENSANPDADTDPDACTARDVSAAMRIPDNMRDDDPVSAGSKAKNIHGNGYTIKGSEGEKTASKNALCKAAYDKMTNACYKDMPCSGCEEEVKQFSTACGYVGRVENIGALGSGVGMAIGKGGGRTLDGRSNVPINKLPQR